MREANTHWPIRIVALALAIMAWALLSFTQREQRGEIELDALVQYTNRPSSLVVLNPVPRVNVRLGGPISRMGSLNPLQVNVVVDLSKTSLGIQQVQLLPANVNRPQGIDVVSIEPNLLSLEMDELVTDLRPVTPRLVGEPAAGAVVLDPTVFPANVPIKGPRSVLSGVQSLETGPISLNGHAIEFEEQTVVRDPDPRIEVLTKVVTVRVPLEIPGASSTVPDSSQTP